MEDNNKFQIKTPSEEEMKKAHEDHMLYLRRNPNNFSFWFPQLKTVRDHGIHVPESYIVEVPEEVYRAFFQERGGDKRLIRQWVHQKILPVIKEHFHNKEVFVKNGCYSGKFSFDKCCHIPADATLKEITEHLCDIQYDALCAGLNGAGGYLEIVIREWIRPENFTEKIYGGMPLRPEIRMFYDFTSHRPLYAVNYWDWDYCHEAIAYREEDFKVYERVYPSLLQKLRVLTEKHWHTICEALRHVQMQGMWSVDFILEEKMVWMIDAAIASMSAYWDPEKAANENDNINI